MREVTCSSVILYNQDRQILFHVRDTIPTIAYPNYWAIPGGHVERDESPADAMQRELDEELDYHAPVIFWKTYDFWRTKDTLVHQYIYLSHWTDAPVTVHGFEGQAWRWMSAADLHTFPIAFGFDQLCQECWQWIQQLSDNSTNI